MILPSAVLKGFDKAIELALSLDEESRTRLSRLNGKRIRVNLTRPRSAFLVSVDNSSVVLSQLDLPEADLDSVADASNSTDGADVTITGSVSALRSMLDGNDALYSGEVVIEGDIAVSQHLKEVLAQMDLDWQEAVSPYLGDSFTHRLDTAQSRLLEWLKRTREGTRQNTSEYLQEEIELVASNAQVRIFCEEVDELRAAVDRLEARLQRLELREADET